MMRVNFILFFALLLCACGVVTARYQSRNVFIALEQAQADAKQMDVDYGRLELEQSTWAEHSRIEQIATRQIGMQQPDASHTQVIVVPGGAQ